MSRNESFQEVRGTRGCMATLDPYIQLTVFTASSGFIIAQIFILFNRDPANFTKTSKSMFLVIWRAARTS